MCLFTQHKKALVRRFIRVAFYPQPPVLPPPVGDSAHFSRRLPTIARLIRRISNLLCFSMFLLINLSHKISLNELVYWIFLFKVPILCEFLEFNVILSDPWSRRSWITLRNAILTVLSHIIASSMFSSHFLAPIWRIRIYFLESSATIQSQTLRKRLS